MSAGRPDPPGAPMQPPPSPEAQAYAREVATLVRGCIERLQSTPVDLEAEPAPVWDPLRG